MVLAVGCAALVLGGCGGLFGLFGGTKGLVTFASNPRYDDPAQEACFAAVVQYHNLKGRATEVEYQLLDGATEIASGSAEAATFDEVSKSWETGEIRVSVPLAQHSGKIITVFLDPDAKLTSDQWLDPALDGRRKDVTIP